MGTLNDIPPYLQEVKTNNWSPKRGLVKAVIYTMLMAFFLSTLLCSLEWLEPGSTIIRRREFPSRAFIGSAILALVIGVLITKILFTTAHHASGMVGILGNYIAFLAVMVICSKHIVFAINGVDLTSGFCKGWVWLYPKTIFLRNLTAWFGIGVGVYIFKDGNSIRSWFAK